MIFGRFPHSHAMQQLSEILTQHFSFQNEINNPKFNFLNPGDPYHAYYKHKVVVIRYTFMTFPEPLQLLSFQGGQA